MTDLFDAGPAQHDPGGKVRLKMPPGCEGDAGFSDCGRYRPWLSRNWGAKALWAAPYVLWIGMNPSVADADADDPTIRREMGFTSRMGCYAYFKTNVMDYRATHPDNLLNSEIDPCSADNVQTIIDLAHSPRCRRVMAAWGALPHPLRQYAEHVVEALVSVDLYCMGLTADGSPRHPLYLRNDAQPMLWRAAYREEKP